ncbi:PIG-L family deacetylase [Candidatus Thorarchaeota archaeon]|jgi:LmbE family N-acetylglucosaminyl deacetylase|nr:MAG: PIG-L family deacetylase [Candidatus Thorarchaeota archaeon]
MNSPDDTSLLVVIAHPDDECLGAGGTIASHAKQGIDVDLLCLTGNPVRNRELEEAAKILGVRNLLTMERDDFAIDRGLENRVVEAILQWRPKSIITHSEIDYNRNHVACANIVLDAIEWASHVTQFERAHRVDRVYQMEVNTLLSKPNVMINVTDSYDTALEALRCHKSQMDKADGYYERFYDARTRLRGVQSACDRAEAFCISLPKHAGPFYPKNCTDRLE